MNIQEIRGKTDHELRFELGKARKELFDLRFKSASQSLSNPAQIRVLRREIARLRTVLQERALGVRAQEPR